MTWFRMDDLFPTHPKVRSIPKRARSTAKETWMDLGCYSSRVLTDGLVKFDDVVDEGHKATDAQALVDVGLWHGPGDACEHTSEHCPGTPPPGHYQFHDWYDFNRSREQILAERAASTKRQKEARERAAEKRRRAEAERAEQDSSRRDSRCDSRRESQGSHGVSHGPPDPTRPDLSTFSSPRSSSESSVTRAPTSLAGQIVVVYTETSKSGGVSPIADQTTIVGRQARELLDEGNEFSLVAEAAVLAAAANKPWIADFIGPAVAARQKAAASIVSPTDPIWGATLGGRS